MKTRFGKKERMEAAQLRMAFVGGYRDLIDGRVVEFKGDLRKAMKEAKRPGFINPRHLRSRMRLEVIKLAKWKAKRVGWERETLG